MLAHEHALHFIWDCKLELYEGWQLPSGVSSLSVQRNKSKTRNKTRVSHSAQKTLRDGGDCAVEPPGALSGGAVLTFAVCPTKGCGQLLRLQEKALVLILG